MSHRDVWKLRLQRTINDSVLQVAEIHTRVRERWRARERQDEQAAREHISPLIFSPLPGPRHIRLLELLPGDDGAEVVCNLTVHALEECPYFEAVSYTWGDWLPRCAITCGGLSITIGPSLDWGLRRVRKKTESRTLWIDALCINQLDLVEKSGQIRLMRQIYARADWVLVWLGPDGSDEADAVSSLMYRFWQVNDKEVWDGALKRYMPKPPANMDHMTNGDSQLDMTELSDPKWLSVQRFFSIDFFKRVWIIQEVLAARKLVAYWGSKDLSLDFIGPMAFCLTKFIDRHFKDGTYPPIAPSLASAGYIWGLGTAMKVTKHPIYLHEIMIKGYLSRCTDPRDRVFGLLGVTCEGRELERANTPALLIPDYSKTCLEVFRDAARYVITVSNADDPRDQYRLLGLWAILYLAGPTSSWPSWTPWWHEAHAPFRFMIWFCDTKFFSPAYLAAGATKVEVRPSPPSILSLHGILVDKIMIVDPIPAKMKSAKNSDWCWNWIRLRWRRWLALIPDIKGAAQPSSAADALCEFALAITVVGDYLLQAHQQLLWDVLEWFKQGEDQTAERMKAAGHSEKSIQDYKDETQIPTAQALGLDSVEDMESMPEIIQWLQMRNKPTPELLRMYGFTEPQDQQDSIETTEKMFPQTPAAARAAAKPEQFQQAIQAGATGRSALIVTEKGFIGVACIYAQVGDVLCVPYGFPVPIILHPVRTHYKHRGFGHFPALMSGKAMNLKDQGIGEETWFDIH